MSKKNVVQVDDQDPRVKYNGVWPVGGSPNEFKETVASSTRVGDSFVVPFYGVFQITLHGTTLTNKNKKPEQCRKVNCRVRDF